MRRLLLLAGLLLASPAMSDVAEPPAYRGEPYRAPVPATLEGAQVVDAAAAHALWAAGEAVFVDVMPRPPRPANLPEGTIWRQPPRETIPGATWLPNVGYEALADIDLAYFRQGLELATDGERTRPLVFFCLADCWMSWNAAKRALEGGYAKVLWFPDGTDGWAFEDFPLEAAEPLPHP